MERLWRQKRLTYIEVCFERSGIKGGILLAKSSCTKKPVVAIVLFPMGSRLVVNVFCQSIVSILEPICKRLYVISGNKACGFSKEIMAVSLKTSLHLRGSVHPIWWSDILQFFKIIAIQLEISFCLLKTFKDVEIVYFYIGGANLILPVIVTKLSKRRVITSALGLGSMSYIKSTSTGMCLLASSLCLLEHAIFHLADSIVVESPAVSTFLALSKYKHKIAYKGARFIDTDKFRVKKDLSERRCVGYIGRLSREKGIMNFIEAIPCILKQQENIEFLIVGDGPLYSKIRDEIDTNGISHRVKLFGWIPHDKVADYFNDLKLLVLPSYSEGLPTAILEAMACGTPVMATRVGGIPDVVKDGETGFILNNNLPEYLAEEIIKALNYYRLHEISENAVEAVRGRFSYENAVKGHQEILSALQESRKDG